MRRWWIALACVLIASCAIASQVPADRTSIVPGGNSLPYHNLTIEEGLPAAAVTGTLVQDVDCVWIDMVQGGRYLAIWPEGTALAPDGSGLILPDLFLPFGNELDIGGGEVTLDASALQATVIPDDCTGAPLWLVGFA